MSTAYITQLTIEHVVVPSRQSYEHLVVALEARLGLPANWDLLMRQLAITQASWEQITQRTQALIGTSGFTIFARLDQGILLSLAGNPRRVSQYVLGNHLLGIQMIEHRPEVGLYAPLRIVVYEDDESRAFITYDRLTSFVSQYQHEEITNIARLVDQKLEELVTEITGSEREMLTEI